MLRYYVYVLSDPRTKLPFYIGMADRTRTLKRPRHEDHAVEAERFRQGKRWKHLNTRKLTLLASILDDGLEVTVNLWFETDLLVEAECAERKAILQFGRLDLQTGLLTNMTDGGTGGITHDSRLKASSKSAKMKQYYQRIGQRKRASLAKSRGQGVSKAWALLTQDEKQRRLSLTILSENARSHTLTRLKTNGFYWDEKRREIRIPKLKAAAIKHWESLSDAAKKLYSERSKAAYANRDQNSKDLTAAKIGASSRKSHAENPHLYANCHSEATRAKRGLAIKEGWARRNASLTDEQREKQHAHYLRIGRLSGESRRNKKK